VNTKNPGRGPLLIIDGEKDHTVPWAIANAAYKRQSRNQVVTEIVKIPGRGHSLTLDHGWREVAQTAHDFVKRFVPPSRARLLLMNKPRIFLGSSGEQAKLLRAIERGLSEIADVEPWTTTFNPGRSTLDRLVELSGEVDFAAFVFAQDDWTTTDASQSGQASPRDNVVFEAGLFGGALGIRRTFILHAHGSKLPSDLLGLTSVRYDPATSPAEVRAINQKLRKAIETEGRRGQVEGLWWQLSLTMRSDDEPSAVSLLRISRDRDGGLNVNGRSWQEDGALSARYWSEAAKERTDPASIFYYWKGERPRHPNAPQLEGTGEIRVESADRATGYWTTRSDRDPGLNARTSGVYLRADPSDLEVLDGVSEEERAELIAQRLRDWKSAANAF
jgi:predicted nucleotide-binding protein